MRYTTDFIRSSRHIPAHLLYLTQQRAQRPIAPDSGFGDGGISGSQVDGKDPHDVESNVSLLDLVRSTLN
jgi:hypothetical protein